MDLQLYFPWYSSVHFHTIEYRSFRKHTTTHVLIIRIMHRMLRMHLITQQSRTHDHAHAACYMLRIHVHTTSSSSTLLLISSLRAQKMDLRFQ
jgi:hypothetical protein